MNVRKYNNNNRIIKGNLFIFLFFTMTSLVLLRSGPAWGHKVSVFAYAEGKKIFTESYFNNGTPCKDSIIQVFDSEGKELLEGKTDRDGFFSFEIPKKTDLRIVLTASLGHKADFILEASEITDLIAEPRLTADQKCKVAEVPDPITESLSISDHNGGDEKISLKNADHDNEETNFKQHLTTVDFEQLSKVVKESVEEAVENGMRPLMRALAKTEATRISFTEIIGGIGYIFGIMGIIIYFKKKEN